MTPAKYAGHMLLSSPHPYQPRQSLAQAPIAHTPMVQAPIDNRPILRETIYQSPTIENLNVRERRVREDPFIFRRDKGTGAVSKIPYMDRPFSPDKLKEIPVSKRTYEAAPGPPRRQLKVNVYQGSVRIGTPRIHRGTSSSRSRSSSRSSSYSSDDEYVPVTRPLVYATPVQGHTFFPGASIATTLGPARALSPVVIVKSPKRRRKAKAKKPQPQPPPPNQYPDHYPDQYPNAYDPGSSPLPEQDPSPLKKSKKH
eukprot:TRINITY_DN1799_c0_g1_i1.p1 TRINITY_DN1799_c0_g1~~TRINITY_DN1799_c0_g1_i1.p1  ORF type:complete len:255 (-),score=33.26 TRINITY_DN1799_c0_g1_i1:134-898(-)